jgi:antitoxin component YwqK of YwqJK toxin-antitoxin module
MGIFDSIKRKYGYDIKNRNGINEEYWDVYEVGKILRKKYYKKNGKYHGKYQEFLNSGSDIWAEIEISYKNGIKDGLTRYFWKKHVSAEGNFTNGKETGIIKKYFRYDDELKDIKLHPIVKESADLDRGIYEVFNLDGKLLEKSEIDDVKFEEGSSSSSDGYSGGVYPIRNGICEKWFESGQLKEKGYWGKNNTSSIYNLSHRKGEHIAFHENGNELKKGEWIDKIPIGNHKFYYPSGNIEFEVEYDTAAKAGADGYFPDKEKMISEKWYNEDGSLMSADEIIKKGGIDPRHQPRTSGMHISWAHKTLNQENFVVINGLNFKRMGDVAFYDSYYRTDYSLGHSYSVQN